MTSALAEAAHAVPPGGAALKVKGCNFQEFRCHFCPWKPLRMEAAMDSKTSVPFRGSVILFAGTHD